MHDLERRLARCFSVIFPELNDQEVKRATMENVADWDSVATVTLINVVEEEFGTEIALEDVEDLLSFADFLGYLRQRQAAVAR